MTYRIRPLGMVDKYIIHKALEMGIDLTGGYIRKTDKRVIIGNRLFLSVGLSTPQALRSRIVWWLKTGELLIGWEDGNIHHKNGNRIDDRYRNLEKIDHIEHSLKHNMPGLKDVICKCLTCGKKFGILPFRLKEKGRGSFCSQECYQSYPKPDKKITLCCRECKLPFKVIKSQGKKRIFCSNSCATTYLWKRRKNCGF